MTRYLLFAFADCKDPSREQEFNDWYDNVHVPDMLQVPGMISATRWKSADNKEDEIRKYVAVYEIEADDTKEFSKAVRQRGMLTVEQGRFSDLPTFDPPNVPRIYVQIMDEKRPASDSA